MIDRVIFWRLVYFLPNLLAAFGMVYVACLAWRYRTQRGGLALLWFAVGAFFWTFFEALNFVGLSNEWILFFWCMESIGVSVAPLSMVVAVIDYFGYAHFLTRRRIAILSIMPALELLAAITNPWHEWVWRSIKMDYSWPIPVLTNVPGPMSWASYGYGAFLLFAAISFLLLHLHEMQRPQRQQVYMVIIAMLLPLLATGLYVFGVSPLPNTSPTTVGFLFSGAVLLCGFYRSRMFKLPPVTAFEIYRSQEDAVFVVDAYRCVLDCNQAAKELLSNAAGEVIGKTLAELLPSAQDGLNVACEGGRGEVHWQGHCFDVRVTELASPGRRRFFGNMLVWRDVTERKRLEAELRRLSITDDLTGLYNRRHFFARGEDDIEHAKRYGRPLSLIMVDVDYFKVVNDRYGHEAGDQALSMIASLLASQLRVVDCIGRIGGEEFALLMPETDAEAACEVGKRLANLVRNTAIAVPSGATFHLTVSIGIVTRREDEVTVGQLLRRADDALYQAKHQGRDRLVQL